jgi:hypothetical protein
MIPLHLRCTERHKIDPEYPTDDARWWRLQEQRASVESDRRPGIYARIPDVVASWFCENPDYADGAAIADVIGIGHHQFLAAMKNYRKYGTLRRDPPAFYSGEMTEQEIAFDKYLRQDKTL